MEQLACASKIKAQKIVTLIGRMSNDFLFPPNFIALKLNAMVIG